MLTQILSAFENVNSPMSLDGLSQQLDVEKSALEGMLEILIRKGKLKASQVGLADQDEACTTITCAGCRGATRCPFVGKLPRTFEVVRKKGEALYTGGKWMAKK